MKTMFSKATCSLASLLLALTFTLSCSNDDNEDGNSSQSTGNPEWEQAQEYYKYYDPDEGQRCQNGVVEEQCMVNGGTWFNPLQQVCLGEGWNYELGVYSTYTLVTIQFCGSLPYLSSGGEGEIRCQGGVLQKKCGNDWYNEETHYCKRDWDGDTDIYTLEAKTLCGSKYYVPEDYNRCKNGVVEEQCGPDENAWYNEDTHYCKWDWDGDTGIYTLKAMTLCGSEYIYPDYQRCSNGAVEYKCGESDAWYNRITQSCNEENGTVKTKLPCGS